MVYELKEISEKEFRKFADKQEQKSFFQTPEIGELNRRNGAKIYYLGMTSGKELLAATMIIARPSRIGKKIFYSPRGPLIDYFNDELLTEFFSLLKKFVREHDGFVFKFDPYFEKWERDIDGNLVDGGFDNTCVIDSLKKLGIKVDPKPEQIPWMFALDVREKTPEDGRALHMPSGKKKSIDELKKDFRANTRNIINKTLKSGITLRDLKKDEISEFKKMLDETATRKGFHDRTLEYYENMYDVFEKNIRYVFAELKLDSYIKLREKELNENEKLLSKLLNEKDEEVLKKNKGRISELEVTIAGIKKKITKASEFKKDGDIIPLSSGMFLLYGDEVLYLFSGNYEKYMFFDAQYLIQWEMINYALDHGYKRYNFYGISGKFDKNDPTYGMYEFKKGFNGRVIELIGGFEMPVTWHYRIHKLLEKIKR